MTSTSKTNKTKAFIDTYRSKKKAAVASKKAPKEAELFPKRHPDYWRMSPREQWEDDKNNGYLDM